MKTKDEAFRAPEEYRLWWKENTDVPYGLCWCGCGKKTKLAKQTNGRLKHVRNEPVRYVATHVNRKITDEQEIVVCEMYAAGTTASKVGTHFAISATTVCAILKKHGVASRPASPRLFTEEEELEICALYTEGRSGVEIAKIYGSSHEMVYKTLKRYGISSGLAKAEQLTLARQVEVCRRYIAGHTLQMICEAMDVEAHAANLALENWQIGPQQEPLSEAEAGSIARALNLPVANIYGAIASRDIGRGTQPRVRDEAALQDRLANYLRGYGFKIETEKRMARSGRCDIAASNSNELTLIVEVKVADPLRGIGQLLAYRSGWEPKPALVLAVPSDDFDWSQSQLACNEAGIELWLIGSNGHPHRACGPFDFTYPLHAVPSAFE